MIAAVFDLDRTLLPDTTAERLFLRYLARRRRLGLRSAVETIWFLLRHGEGDPVRSLRRHRPYLAGLSVPELLEAGKRCYDEAIRPRLSAEGVRRLAEHRARGHRIVVLSGSLPYVVGPLAESLNADDVICSRLEVRGNRLTGRLIGLHPYGESKRLLMQRAALEYGIDLANSYCYADHHSDEPMLRLFGHPVCINPSLRLRATAQSLGWPIEEFR